MRTHNVFGVTDAIEFALQNVTERTGKDPRDSCLIRTWTQNWPSTTCGFGGIGGHAFTLARTVTITLDTWEVYVYHNDRFAYYIKDGWRDNNPSFFEAQENHNLPGAGKHHAKEHEMIGAQVIP